MKIRHEYYLNIDSFETEPLAHMTEIFYLRKIEISDMEKLSILMLDAFINTVDYEGENIEESRQEISRYLGDKPMLEYSIIMETSNKLAAAILVSKWNERKYPWISYVMTSSDFKNNGLAKIVLGESLRKMKANKVEEVGAMITEGNIPSERLFISHGFNKQEYAQKK